MAFLSIGKVKLLCLSGLFAILALPSAMAQYEVFYWENFETEKFPSTLAMWHNSKPENTSAFRYQTPGAPGTILLGRALTECGNYGLRLQTDNDHQVLSVVNNDCFLDRRLLGNKGKALFQADIFYSLEDNMPSNIAVLAISPDSTKDSKGWQLYRFGLTPSRNKLFFSHFNLNEVPKVYLEEDIQDYNLKNPGWHRFQIIFDGQENIICAINGHPTKFSPIKDSSLKSLRAGVIAVSRPERNETCYVDNLSIQWTNEEAPIPDSPWLEGAAQAGQAPRMPGGAVPPPSPSTLKWMTDPNSAWTQMQADKRPILFLLYAPRLSVCEQLNQIMATDTGAQSLLGQYNLLRVDVNQLSGGRLAQKFNVFRVPCIIIIGSDGAEQERIVWTRTTDWASVQSRLQQAGTK